ncbi:MAG: efflux RND transporter permease subunit [Myxococcaceae bacterium]
MNRLRGRAPLVWLTALGLAALGAWNAHQLPSGIYPEVEFPRIVVVARAGDAPPDVTQVALTRPLETALATVLGVERIRSRTIRGNTEISLQFTPGTDMWRALQLVDAQVSDARASLPPGTEVSVERLTTTSFPVVTLNLSGQLDPRVLREAGELTLKPALTRVRGVGRVEVLGGDVREVEIIADPGRLAALRLTPKDVAQKVRQSVVLSAVGRVEEAHAFETVVASSEPRAVDDLKTVPVALGPDGSPIALGTIAAVTDGAEDKLLRVSGPLGETVLVSVSRLPGASTPDVVERALEAIAQVKPALPPGVKVDVVYDQAALVDESMRSVRDAILLGIALSIGVIALFLRDLRSGLVAAVAVPLTLGATFVPMKWLGQSLNLMSLGGMAVAIGLVIDDAIVVVEAIRRRLEEGAPVATAVTDGVRLLLGPLIGTTATTVIVLLPLAGLEGVVGRFFTALAATLASAVILSLAVSVTVVPLLASRAMKPRAAGPGSAGWVQTSMRRVLAPALQRRWLGWAGAALLLVVGAVSLRFVGSGFLPEMDEGAFVLDYFLPASASLTDTDAAARKIEAVLRTIPEVQTWSRRTGAELGPVTATLVSRGDIMVRLKPRSQRTRSAEEVISDARERVEKEVPAARVEFVMVLQDVLNDLAGTPRPIEIKVFGEDYAVLRQLAAEISARIETVPGLVDAYQGFDEDSPQLTLRVDPANAARLGKSSQDVSDELNTALHGEVAAQFRRPDRPIGIRVRYPDAVRFDPEQLQQLPLLAPQGVTSVAAVTQLERNPTPTTLVREQMRPVVILTADHEGRDLGSVTRDVQARLRLLRLPTGYSLELGGQAQAQQETFQELLRVAAFGALAVLLVLLAQFRRAATALLVLLTAPLSVVGGLVTLWATGVPLNASALMGCILLLGLAVKNSILLLERAEDLLASGANLTEAMTGAAELRLRPILMTTLATIAGLAPLALGIGAGAELQRPLALVVIGGLLISTAVSLVVLPSLATFALRRADLKSS